MSDHDSMFSPSEYAELTMNDNPTNVNLTRVMRQLDRVAQNLNTVQNQLSNLVVRYEYIVANMEKELSTVNRDIETLYSRISAVERFIWKVSGALALAVIVGQVVVSKL